MKTCPRCRQEKPLTEFDPQRSRGGKPKSHCKSCCRTAARAWRASRPNYEKERYQKTRAQTRERHLIRKYGVSLADYRRMLAAQGGKCAICGALEADQHNGVFHVDHCHATGAVRGLLCSGCNHVLGHVRDDPEVLWRAIAYLGVVPQVVEAIGRAVMRAAA